MKPILRSLGIAAAIASLSLPAPAADPASDSKLYAFEFGRRSQISGHGRERYRANF